MLQSLGWPRVGHNLVTEKQSQDTQCLWSGGLPGVNPAERDVYRACLEGGAFFLLQLYTYSITYAVTWTLVVAKVSPGTSLVTNTDDRAQQRTPSKEQRGGASAATRLSAASMAICPQRWTFGFSSLVERRILGPDCLAGRLLSCSLPFDLSDQIESLCSTTSGEAASGNPSSTALITPVGTFKKMFIGVRLIYNVVLVSGAQQSESAMQMHTSTVFQILFPEAIAGH